MPANANSWALTEKEKQTLRLIVRGHDAKSTARSLGLSVHTINERLRDARRKMAVSSSREAARLLLQAEGGDPTPPHPELLGDMQIGEDAAHPCVDQGATPTNGVRRIVRRPWINIGVPLMSLALGLLAVTALPHFAAPPPQAPSALRAAQASEQVVAAQRWLELLDQGQWDASYRATGASFRSLNTLEVWTAASEKARSPLGAMLSRAFLSQQDLPAPPHGYVVVKFSTRFANKPDAVETVTLDREDGQWRVVGVTIE